MPPSLQPAFIAMGLSEVSEGGRLVAALSVGRPEDLMHARRLLAAEPFSAAGFLKFAYDNYAGRKIVVSLSFPVRKCS